ncbi:DNA-directed RNA polymerase specialized sigma24 family protein [Catenulispora sp. GP43]|uniref:BACON domain-containing protein n=1 Tax=Catenulispora sp. GP43 TaxID=3156263 RepID=UPI003515F59F
MKDHDSNATDPLDPADPVNRDSVSDSWGRAAAYDAYADGLHTYALGGLRHHEAAASAVYCAFVAADHHVAHLGDAEMLRPWLYAITRHYCRAGKLPRLRLAASPAAGSASVVAPAAKDASMAELERTLLSAELASLDWPDTDGLTAAHREVLELSVRHGMESRAVGMMLGKPAAESFEVLSQAWHELERSLAALALLRTSRSHCPDLAALAAGWSGRLTAQRREPLVAHVDACSRCQYHLHKVLGAPQAPSILPHVPAPRELRERVLGDLLDSTPEKAAEKAAIATRLTRFDPFGFPAIATPRPPSERPQHQPRTAAPMPVERRQRRLGALLAGRVSSAAAEAVAGEVATAPERLRTPAPASPDAKTPANTMDEGSGLDGAVVSAGTERRRRLRRGSAELDEGPIAPRRGLAADAGAPRRGGAATGDERAAGVAGVAEFGAERGGLAEDLLQRGGPAEGWSAGEGYERGTEGLPQRRSARASFDRDDRAEALAGGAFPEPEPEPDREPAALPCTEVLAGLRAEDLVASFGPARDSSIEDTLITARTAREPGVFDDVRPVRPVPTRTRGPVPRNSVAAAVEGRRRGIEAVRRGVAPVGDAYEAAASAAASVAAGDPAGARVPPIAPVGVMPTAVMPLGMMPGARAAHDATRVFTRPMGGAPDPRRRNRPGVKSALASSAVLSGVGAAGVTAFVLFVPSSPAGTKTLFTPPDPGANSSQTPDYPRPSSSPDAGPALPVAGSVRSGGLPGGDTVTAQVVAAVLPTTPSSSAPTAGSSLPFNGPVDPPPSQTSAPSQDPSGDAQLHISVSQRSNNPGDVDVTLWNSGTSPISWAASPDASWLSLSATSGMLAGGAQTSVHILVDSSAAPSGPWTAHVRFDPSGQMVSINGVGGSGGGSSSPSGPTGPSSPSSPSGGSPSGPSSTPPTNPSSTPSGTPTSPVSSPSTPHSSAPSSQSASGPSSPSSPGGPTSSSSAPSRGPSSPGGPSTSGGSSTSGGPSSSGGSTSPTPTGTSPAPKPSHRKPLH